MDREDIEGVVLTPKGMDALHDFSADEYRAFKVVHGAMRRADRTRKQVEGRGIGILFGAFVLAVVVAVALLIPEEHNSGDNGITFLIGMAGDAIDAMALVLAGCLALVVLSPVASFGGKPLGRRIYHTKIRTAYQALAAAMAENQPHTARAVAWIETNDPTLAEGATQGLMRFGHLTIANAVRGT